MYEINTRVTRDITEKNVEWAVERGLWGAVVGHCEMDHLLDMTYRAVDRRQNYRIQAELHRIAEEKAALRAAAMEAAKAQALAKMQKDYDLEQEMAAAAKATRRKEHMERLFSRALAREEAEKEENRAREILVKEIEQLRLQKEKQLLISRSQTFARLRTGAGKL